jgi:hypothetical protein
MLTPERPGRGCAGREAETLHELLEATICPLEAADGTTCVCDCPLLGVIPAPALTRQGRVLERREALVCRAAVRGGNAAGVPIGALVHRFTDGGVPLVPGSES